MNGILLEDDNLLIQKTSDADGLITRGLVIGDVTRQNQALIISSHEGEFKENPLLGVGIANYLNSEDTSSLKVAIKKQLKADGQRVSYIGFEADELVVKAEYE